MPAAPPERLMSRRIKTRCLRHRSCLSLVLSLSMYLLLSFVRTLRSVRLVLFSRPLSLPHLLSSLAVSAEGNQLGLGRQVLLLITSCVSFCCQGKRKMAKAPHQPRPHPALVKVVSGKRHLAVFQQSYEEDDPSFRGRERFSLRVLGRDE